MSSLREEFALAEEQSQSLARQARAGDFAALEALVRYWQAPLVRFLQRRVGNRADAEDLFQETCIRVQQNLGRYDDRRPFKTWLFTIAWRLAANHLRGRKNAGICADPAMSQSEAVDPQPTPADVAASADLHSNLWSIAARVLSEEQYGILWLFYVEELSPREIGRVTGKGWIAIKTALHRGRRALAPHLERLQSRAGERRMTVEKRERTAS